LLAEHGFSVADPAVLLTIQVERWMQARERRLKGALARMGNPPVLQRWSVPEWLGLIDYRWRTARAIVFDILVGLGRIGEAANA
ncbi:MAG: hypothetical protein ACP5RC_11380, partial [Halothiobacillaceae bacterium]